jgi:hypothetical protein
MGQQLPGLGQLVAAVDARGPHAGPLDRLAAAVGVADQVRGLGDELLDRMVADARTAGCSWTEIGSAFGVSKQAAQQRFTVPVPAGEAPWPPHFSDAARRVVALADGEARRLGHNYLGTEHLLLGLIEEQDGLAAHALGALGVSAAAVRSQIGEIVGFAPPRRWDGLGVAPRVKKVFELARAEARPLGHRCVGTEHLLLAISHEGEGVAAQILARCDAGPGQVEEQVAGMLQVDPSRLAAPARRRLRARVR